MAKTPEEMKEYRKQYYLKNREKILAKVKLSDGFRRDRRKYQKAYVAARLAQDPEYFKKNNDKYKGKSWLAGIEPVRGSLHKLIQQAKYRAKKLGLPFDADLSVADFEPIPGVCPVLGIQFECESSRDKRSSMSLDRIVPEKGYVRGNVRLVSYRANMLKSNANKAEVALLYEDSLTW